MGVNDKFIEVFNGTKALQLLVIISIMGIVVSVYPVYESVHNNTSRKIALAREWQGLENARKLPPETMDALYDQLVEELNSNHGRVEATFASLSKSESEKSFCHIIWKFLFGGLLYAFFYFAIMYFLCRSLSGNNNNARERLFKRHWPVLVIWFIMGVVNALIPFYSPLVNYVFFPSCFTLLYAVGSLLRNVAIKHVQDSTKKDGEVRMV